MSLEGRNKEITSVVLFLFVYNMLGDVMNRQILWKIQHKLALYTSIILGGVLATLLISGGGILPIICLTSIEIILLKYDQNKVLQLKKNLKKPILKEPQTNYCQIEYNSITNGNYFTKTKQLIKKRENLKK